MCIQVMVNYTIKLKNQVVSLIWAEEKMREENFFLFIFDIK